MNKLKDKIKDKITKSKQKVNEYFQMKDSIATLSYATKKFFIISVGFDEIYNQIKNPKRFKISLLICVITWLVTIWHFLFLISPDLWSLVDSQMLPYHFKTLGCCGTFLLFLCAIAKTDFLLAEINGNIDTFKVLYFLEINLKSLHGLTDKNYKRLAILSRIMITILINYVAPFYSIVGSSFILYVAITSKRLYWFIHIFIMLIPYILIFHTYSAAGSILYIYFIYFKMRFDQLNNQIKKISPNGKLNRICFRKEKILLDLINEHNFLSLEIHKMNLMGRRTAAGIFICFALIKILTLYITIYAKDTLIRFMVFIGFTIFLIFGFGVTYLFSLQINSAKNSYKITHSIMCNCKMNIKLRFKVI